MKMLVTCFLGVLGTTAGTIIFDGGMKDACQMGFLVAAGVSGLLLMMGHFN